MVQKREVKNVTIADPSVLELKYSWALYSILGFPDFGEMVPDTKARLWSLSRMSQFLSSFLSFSFFFF